MDIVKIFATAQSSKISLAGICYQTRLIFSEISKQKAGNKFVSNFVLFNEFLEFCSLNPRLLNKTEIAIQKHNHQNVIHTLLTVKTDDTSIDQIIRTKQSLLSSTRHYSEAPL